MRLHIKHKIIKIVEPLESALVSDAQNGDSRKGQRLAGDPVESVNSGVGNLCACVRVCDSMAVTNSGVGNVCGYVHVFVCVCDLVEVVNSGVGDLSLCVCVRLRPRKSCQRNDFFVLEPNLLPLTGPPFLSTLYTSGSMNPNHYYNNYYDSKDSPKMVYDTTHQRYELG